LSIDSKIRPDEGLLEYLEKNFDHFTPTQKILVNYLTTNIDEAAFLTADEIAGKISTVPSTITRFAKEIGFSGFPEIKNKLREILISKVNSIDQFNGQFEKAKRLKINDKKNAIQSSLSCDLLNLKKLIAMKNEANIKKFVDILSSARKKYIVSSRSSYSLGHFFFFQTNKILSGTMFQDNYDGGMFDVIKELSSEDVVVAISFPRYTKSTFDFAYLANEKGASVLSITDSRLSPLYNLSAVSLLCPCESPSSFHSYVAVLALINAILGELFYRHYDPAIQNLKEEESINQHLKLHTKGKHTKLSFKI
jgi:DNA-binding MurR/RpiR family transcriptional regulator